MRSFHHLVSSSTAEAAAAARDPAVPRLVLTYHERRRSRFGVTLSSGEDIGVALPRRTVLNPGDLLVGEDGGRVVVEAAAETVSVVRCADPFQLTRAAYHLGNRHVALQIRPGELTYLHDHVLDGLVAALGLEVTVLARPFDAEPGPYGSEAGQGDGLAGEPGRAHHHGHEHGHEHGHGHEHEHAVEHRHHQAPRPPHDEPR
jgi:urease accessory protein